MTDKIRLALFVLLIFPLFGEQLFAEAKIDVDYAEMMPLASASMLLDITRTQQGFVAVGERGHIVLSTDGTTWTQAEHVPTRATLTTVFSIGGRVWAGGHDATVLTSGDGGHNWTLQNADLERQQAVMDISFSSETDGLVIGSYGMALMTEDGGITWEENPVDIENEYHLNNLIRLEDGRQMIAGEAGYSYRSFDSGQTWEPIDMPYIGSMWGGISLPGGCVLFYGLRGHILETCDFGENWNELATHSKSSLSGAVYQNGMLVFAGNSGVVLTRDTDGEFTIHHHHSGVDFASVIALDDGKFLLVGEDGVHLFPEEVGADK